MELVTEGRLPDTVGVSLETRESLRRASRRITAVTIPGYSLLEVLGRGTFGTVWRGIREKTGQSVAVKVVEQGEALDWDYFRRELDFLREIEDHPHTLTVLDAQLDQEPRYIVMPLAEGGSLENRVRAEKPGWAETIRWLQQIAQALSFIHRKGVIHCDLKPSNVLLSSAGDIRIGDLGQARRPGKGLALGTIGFMAPEQCAEEGRNSPSVGWDVYGFGATAYWLLSGRIPRLEPTLDAYIAAFERPLERLPEGVDPELAAIVESCLHPDPARRPPTMDAVLDDLERRRNHEPLLCRRPWSFPYLARVALRRRGVRAALVSLAGLSLLAYSSFQNHLETRYLTYLNNGIHAHESGRLEEAYLNWLEALRYRPGSGATLQRLHFMPLAQIYPQQDRVNDFRLLENGLKIVTGTADGEVSFWDAPEGKRLASFRHPAHISEVVVSPNERMLATGAWDGRARLFDVERGRLLHVLSHEIDGYEPSITTVSFVDAGAALATADLQGRIKLWNSEDGSPRRFAGPAANPEVRQLLTAHPNRPLLAALVAPHTAALWDVRGGGLLPHRFPHRREINALAFTPDGRHLLSASDDNTVSVWSVESGDQLASYSHDARVNALVVIDGSRFASGCEDGVATVWEIGEENPRQQFFHRRPVRTLAASRDGRLLAVGTGESEHLWSDIEPNGTVQVWDAEDGCRVGGPWPHDGPVERVEFSPREPLVFSASGSARHATAVYPGAVRAWRFHEPTETTSDWSEDGGERTVNGSVVLDNGVVLSHGENVRINHHASHAGRHLTATASEDRTVRLWNSRTGDPHGPSILLDGPARAVAFSPDGSVLATAVEGVAGHSLVRLWEVDSGYPISPALSCPATVVALDLSPDSLTVHTGSSDFTWTLAENPGSEEESVRRRLRARLNALGEVVLAPDLSEPVMTVELP